MKKWVFCGVFGILSLGLMTSGLIVEFVGVASTDRSHCFMSPHNRGCENDLPIVKENEEIKQKNLENYFISDTLSDYFSSAVFDEVLTEPLQDEGLTETSQDEYLSIHFD